MIPKDGGNAFHGMTFGDFTYKAWSASNLTDHLTSLGLTNVSRVYHISDVNPGVGGPIAKDKLWFLGLTGIRFSIRRLSTATTTESAAICLRTRPDSPGSRRRAHSERIASADVAGDVERQNLGVDHRSAQGTGSLRTDHRHRARRAGTPEDPDGARHRHQMGAHSDQPADARGWRWRRAQFVHRKLPAGSHADDLFDHRPGERQVLQCVLSGAASTTPTCRTTKAQPPT